MSTSTQRWIDDRTFRNDVDYIEALWQQRMLGRLQLPLLDIGTGDAVVFVPILEHLEFVYARQIRALSQRYRVILYRRQETRRYSVGMAERVEELRQILDGLGLEQADLVAHGDAAMVLFEFALRYPQRCRSLTIIAQGADYRITPHPLIWLLHEGYIRLPVEYLIPASFLRQTVIKYITAHAPDNETALALPAHLIEEQFRKIPQWPLVYKFSVLPVIHSFDIRSRIRELTVPILLLNRADDVLAPETKTRWLAENLPYCAGYHVISGRERFFMYSQSQIVTPLLEAFLDEQNRVHDTTGQIQ